MKTLFQQTWVKVSAGILLGILSGWLIFGGGNGHGNGHDHAHAHNHESGSTEVWTCSMHPSVRDDQPGTCPICAMDLIPASALDGGDDQFSLTMTEADVQLANIQTTEVRRERPVFGIWAPGSVEVNEQNVASISGHYNGRITRLYADFTGAVVQKGDPLAAVYSDDLVLAQRELLEAWRRRDASPSLYRATRQRLRYWDLSDAQIDAIISRGEPSLEVDIKSPATGTIIRRVVSRNDYIQSGSLMFEIADLSTVWLVFDVFESDIDRIKTGQQITFSLRRDPGNVHEAKIVFVEPVLNRSNRTVRVRAEAANTSGKLKPGLLLDGRVEVTAEADELLIPASAVLWTGTRSVVYVKDMQADTPRFESREVTLGPRAGDHYVIRDGLSAGEHVVFHGAFRIDSEMQLADKFSMMNRTPGMGAVPAGHHGHGAHGTAHEVKDHFEDVPSSFKSDFRRVVTAYLKVRDALVESDLSESRAASEGIVTGLQHIGEHGLAGSGHQAWMQSWQQIMHHTNAMKSADNLDTFRSEFRHVSDLFIVAVKQFGVEGVVYQQYCPMAFGDQGAHWISESDQIRNPYLPETMLMCGEVITGLGAE